MERTLYEQRPAVPLPPPDPAELRVVWSENLSQLEGKGWIAFKPGVQDVHAFFKERYALKWVTKEEDDG